MVGLRSFWRYSSVHNLSRKGCTYLTEEVASDHQTSLDLFRSWRSKIWSYQIAVDEDEKASTLTTNHSNQSWRMCRILSGKTKMWRTGFYQSTCSWQHKQPNNTVTNHSHEICVPLEIQCFQFLQPDDRAISIWRKRLQLLLDQVWTFVKRKIMEIYDMY